MSARSVPFDGDDAEAIQAAAEEAGVPFEQYVHDAAVRSATRQRAVAAAGEAIAFTREAFAAGEAEHPEAAQAWQDYREAEAAAEQSLAADARGTAA